MLTLRDPWRQSLETPGGDPCWFLVSVFDGGRFSWRQGEILIVVILDDGDPEIFGSLTMLIRRSLAACVVDPQIIGS